jgi:hypothetical protein
VKVWRDGAAPASHWAAPEARAANELDGRSIVQARGTIFTDGTRRGQLRAAQGEDHAEQQVVASFVLQFPNSQSRNLKRMMERCPPIVVGLGALVATQ